MPIGGDPSSRRRRTVSDGDPRIEAMVEGLNDALVEAWAGVWVRRSLALSGGDRPQPKVNSDVNRERVSADKPQHPDGTEATTGGGKMLGTYRVP